jgi:hypothetical protein
MDPPSASSGGAASPLAFWHSTAIVANLCLLHRNVAAHFRQIILDYDSDTLWDSRGGRRR